MVSDLEWLSKVMNQVMRMSKTTADSVCPWLDKQTPILLREELTKGLLLSDEVYSWSWLIYIIRKLESAGFAMKHAQ